MDPRPLQFVLFVTVALAHLAAAQNFYQCNIRNLDKCLEPLESQEYNGVFPAHSEAEVNHLCSLYNTTKKCLEPLLPNCHPDMAIHFEDYLKLVKFICEDHLDDFRQHRTCFSGVEINKEGSKCNATLVQEFEDLDRKSPFIGITAYIQEACRLVKKYLSCLYEVAERHCGAKAAAWMEKLTEVEMEMVLESPFFNCLVPTKSTTTKRTSVTPSVWNPKGMTTVRNILSSLRPTATASGRKAASNSLIYTIVGPIVGLVIIILILVVVIYILACKRRQGPIGRPVSHDQPIPGQTLPSGYNRGDGMANPVYIVNEDSAGAAGVGHDNPTYMYSPPEPAKTAPPPDYQEYATPQKSPPPTGNVYESFNQ